MAKGGARSRSGPAPTSRERSHKAKSDAQGWTTLPPEGRDGPLPPFPLIAPEDREYEIWEQLWELPQAVMWEQMHVHREVASYVRLLVRAELPGSSSLIWGQVKMHAESLGLSVSGMQRNRWTIGEDSPAGEVAAPMPGVTSIADRLKAARSG